MKNILNDILDRGVISRHSIPTHVPESLQYLTVMGSQAYGVADEDSSDMDVYGFSIPPKKMIFPHLEGYIPGFDNKPESFESWAMHHVIDPKNNQEYDFTVYSIVKYFSLLMQNNPNMVDSIYTKKQEVLYSSPIADMVRENRHIFLHKGCWPRFTEYANTQLKKMRGKTNSDNPKRKELIEKYGYDVKFAYHIVRLLDEVEQILRDEDLNLTRSRIKLKAIRRGEWTMDEIENYYKDREKQLIEIYEKSNLPEKPNKEKIRTLLMNCLEMHYGNLSDCVVDVNKADRVLEEVAELIRKAGY